jgi:hypothetical protein
MNPSRDRPVPTAWRAFFLVAGLYDALLGLVFLLAGETILTAIGMKLPPYIAYIHLSAIFIVVQGLSYLLVYRDAWSNLGLVWVGVAYKASYAALVFYYLATGQLPSTFFILWAVFDVGFMVGFLVFLRAAMGRRAA